MLGYNKLRKKFFDLLLSELPEKCTGPKEFLKLIINT